MADWFDLPSPVKQVASDSKNLTALTENHELFTWKVASLKPGKDTEKTTTNSGQQQQPVPSEAGATADDEEGEPDVSALLDDLSISTSPEDAPSEAPRYEKVPLPPATKISACNSITAAIADERLYLWRDPAQKQYDKHCPTISSLGEPNCPTLQNILDNNGNPLPIKDVSVGKSHIIALAADGSLFSIGRGWHGELGVGNRLFALRAEEQAGSNYDLEDAVEFAETWQRMDTEGLLCENKDG